MLVVDRTRSLSVARILGEGSNSIVTHWAVLGSALTDECRKTGWGQRKFVSSRSFPAAAKPNIPGTQRQIYSCDKGFQDSERIRCRRERNMNLVRVISINWSSTSFEVPVGKRILTPKGNTHGHEQKANAQSEAPDPSSMYPLGVRQHAGMRGLRRRVLQRLATRSHPNDRVGQRSLAQGTGTTAGTL